MEHDFSLAATCATKTCGKNKKCEMKMDVSSGVSSPVCVCNKGTIKEGDNCEPIKESFKVHIFIGSSAA